MHKGHSFWLRGKHPDVSVLCAGLAVLRPEQEDFSLVAGFLYIFVLLRVRAQTGSNSAGHALKNLPQCET